MTFLNNLDNYYENFGNYFIQTTEKYKQKYDIQYLKPIFSVSDSLFITKCTNFNIDYILKRHMNVPMQSGSGADSISFMVLSSYLINVFIEVYMLTGSLSLLGGLRFMEERLSGREAADEEIIQEEQYRVTQNVIIDALKQI